MSIKDIIGRGTKRTFRPARAEGHLARATGMDVRSRHTPTSQLFTHFEKPTHGFSIKQVIGTSPADRQKFAREMVTYRKQVAEQRQLEAEQRKLAEQLGDAYRETVSYQARQIKSIEDLGKEKQRLQDVYQDTKKAYEDLQKEVAKQKVMATPTPARTTTSSSGRRITVSNISPITGRPVQQSTPTTRTITPNIRLSSSGVGAGAKLQFVRK